MSRSRDEFGTLLSPTHSKAKPPKSYLGHSCRKRIEQAPEMNLNMDLFGRTCEIVTESKVSSRSLQLLEETKLVDRADDLLFMVCEPDRTIHNRRPMAVPKYSFGGSAGKESASHDGFLLSPWAAIVQALLRLTKATRERGLRAFNHGKPSAKLTASSSIIPGLMTIMSRHQQTPTSDSSSTQPLTTEISSPWNRPGNGGQYSPCVAFVWITSQRQWQHLLLFTI